MSRSVLSILVLLSASLTLVACSKSPSKSSPPPSLGSVLSPAAVQKAAQAAKVASLPQPDLNTPDTAYVSLEKGNQVMFLYAAFSGLPPDYNQMAQWYSSEYRMTSDAFKKHDLMAALKPKLDAGIADAKTHPYVTWIDGSPQIGHYDFNRKAFPVGSVLFQQGGYVSFNDNNGYDLAVTNGQAFQELTVTDESKARTIESLVSKWQSMELRIYAFVQSTDDSGTPTVQATITKVQLTDPHGQVLFEQDAPK